MYVQEINFGYVYGCAGSVESCYFACSNQSNKNIMNITQMINSDQTKFEKFSAKVKYDLEQWFPTILG